METLEHNPIAVAADEQSVLNKLEGVLGKVVENQSNSGKVQLVGSDGEFIERPDSILNVLRQVVNYMVEGKVVSLTSINKELTTQEAAALLNVSRPFLIKILEQGKLNYRLVGTHRRIHFDDLMDYKRGCDRKRSQLLDEMVQISEEAGAYHKEAKLLGK